MADLLTRAGYRPTSRSGFDEAGSDTARAVVTPPHLPEAMNVFMHSCAQRSGPPGACRAAIGGPILLCSFMRLGYAGSAFRRLCWRDTQNCERQVA